MAKALKTRASKQSYISPNQMKFEGFTTPFEAQLDSRNRWVLLSGQIPWDDIVNVYESVMRNHSTGASNVNGRVALGAIIIKHMCDLSDEETIQQIRENMYMQYFIGYSSFTPEVPFDPSLFVEIRKRLGADQINQINERVLKIAADRKKPSSSKDSKESEEDVPPKDEQDDNTASTASTSNGDEPTHDGRLIVDATVCPQDIAYPTDLNLLNDAREKSEELIDTLYCHALHGNKKPRTYRKEARKTYLNTAMKRNKTRKEIRRSIKKQLSYLKRNLRYIDQLHRAYPPGKTALSERQQEYLQVIKTLYDQQHSMYKQKTHSIDDRIVSIHQPYVRPIVRGKEKAKVEFGAKIQLSYVAGYTFLDVISWDAFNEGTRLMQAVENHKKRTGYWPEEVLADKIYCNRENRRKLKELGIKLLAKPLGRKPAVMKEHLRPGERNPIEGKFGQAKRAYGLNRIEARLSETSESWIASIILVLNLVKLAGEIPLYLMRIIYYNLCLKKRWFTFSVDPN